MLIKEFYANREVFVTGCTGFMGKALVEKLLRDCPKIKVFYILLRSKKSLSADERLAQLKKDKVFDRIREQCPEVLNKLHAIPGDSEQLGLGIQASDLKLMQNVSIIFHMAANVKFDETLRNAILTNTRATYELIKIAATLKNLVAFMHCSTAYCNPFEDVVEEKVYEMPVDWRQAIKLAETFDESTLNYFSYKYTGHYPNNYCFTKNLSEQIIKEYSTQLPIVLFRPSLVMSAHKEPMPGWVDNLNGAVAGFVGLIVGIMPAIYHSKDVTLDAIPVDFATKLTIVATYKRGMQFIRKEPVPNGLEVINCASGDIYEICINAVTSVLCGVALKNPMENKIWDFSIQKVTYCYYNFLAQMFLISIPMAVVLDMIFLLMRRKPMMVKMSRRVVNATKATLFFASTHFQMFNKNMLGLEKSIPQSEIDTYGIQSDINLNFAQYCENYISGVKYYLFNQPKQATEGALRRSQILYAVNKFIKSVFASLLILYLWSKIKIIF